MSFKKLIILFQLMIFFSCLGISTTAFANQADTNKLTVLLDNLKTYSADFSQQIKDKNGDTLQTSTGRMALKRPGLFRWDTLKPNQQLIVADGKFIWIYDKDLQQITKQKQNQNAQSPGLLLSDSVSHLSKRFAVTSSSNNDFTLTPVKKDLFQSVELQFDKFGNLTNMTLNDNLGHITQIAFSHSAINNSLSANLFKFNPPKNIDIAEG